MTYRAAHESPNAVIPAKAGIQCSPELDSRFRGNDDWFESRRNVNDFRKH